MRRLRDQRGVAMVTVLFVAATLTVVGSTATFITMRELRSATDDRRASEALAFAEAGADRLLLELKRGSITWGHIREAGCAFPPLALPTTTIGNGTYEAYLTVYNPEAPTSQRVPGTPWSAANDAIAPCIGRSDSPRDQQYFAITVKGSHPTATRIVRQALKVHMADLPVGIYAESVSVNGTPDMTNISLITPGDIIGREKLGFTGSDVYYKMSDFWPTMSSTQPAPAAGHAVGSIYYKKSGSSKQEHPPGLNCDANDLRGTLDQSMFDQSGAGGVISGACPDWTGAQPTPPTSKFTPQDLARIAPKTSLGDQAHIILKDAARTSGLYCYFAASGSVSCLREGNLFSGGKNITDAYVTGLPNHVVVYLEFQDPSQAMGSNLITWDANWWGCNSNPDLDKSITIVIRNGSMKFAANRMVNGALFLPEGEFNDLGGHTFNGTIMAKRFDSYGNPKKQLTTCWLQNMPGAFLDVTPSKWAEVDR